MNGLFLFYGRYINVSDFNYDTILEKLHAGERYVFFTSLFEEQNNLFNNLGQEAATALNDWHRTILRSDNVNAPTKMDLALSFLQSAAAFERKKEINFFTNYTSMYPDAAKTFNLTLTPDIDYIKFIAQINQTLKGAAAFEKELNTEYNRILRYRAADKIANGKKEEALSAELKEQYFKALNDNKNATNAKSNDEYYLKLNGKTTFNTLLSDSANISTLTNLIVEEYGSRLFTVKGDHLTKSSTFPILVKLLVDRAYQMLIAEFGKVASKSDDPEKNLAQAQFIVQKNSDFRNFVEALLNAPNLEDSIVNVAHQHNIYLKSLDKVKANNAQIKHLTELLRSTFKQFTNPDNAAFRKWLKKEQNIDIEEMVKSINSVKAQGYYTGEDLSLTDLLRAHIGGVLGGGANPTDDIQAGKLIFNFNITTDSGKINQLKATESKLLKQQVERFNQVTKTTDLDSFVHNTAVLQKLREEQQEIITNANIELGKNKEGLDYLKEHINIHVTVKGYVSAGRDSFDFYQGFEGAAFGSNLSNQLDIISNMMEAGGITLDDKQWLQFAMINAGRNMIGRTYKTSIEDYFSLFVGFLMFNDAYIMVEDAKKYIENKYDSDVSDLHLYELNGVFIPTSYLLQKTWESMNGILNDIQSAAARKQGTRAVLHTYDGKPQRGNWDQTANVATEQTKLEMKFLAGFLDLLNALEREMGQL